MNSFNNEEAILKETFLTEMGMQAANAYVTGTAATSFNFCAFEVISGAGAVVASITEDANVITAFAGETLPCGFICYGRFSSITLTSGKVKLYGRNANS